MIRYACSLTTILLFSCSGGSTAEAPTPLDPVWKFEKLDASRTGIGFVNRLPDNHPTMNVVGFQYFYNGAGVAIGDVNGDDLPDLMFAGNVVGDQLYLNRGDLRFEDVSKTAGIGRNPGWSNGVSMVDIDADGDLDIYVSRGGRVKPQLRANELLINDGTGTFTEQAAKFGLADLGYTTQTAFFDYDLDGDLDAYVLNHPVVPPDVSRSVVDLTQSRDPYAGDRLYRNEGGRFVDASAEAGITGNAIGYGLSVSVGDLNDDGYPDLYVCNDYLERDYLYINQGDGTFRDDLKASMPHISQYSMGSDIGDFDNDRRLDVLVADMAAPDNYRQKTMMQSMNVPKFREMVTFGFHYQYSFNTLQRNNGDGTFSDTAQLAGLARTDWSWAALLLDLDNDGWRDVFITNGRRKESSNVDLVNQKRAYQSSGGLQGPGLLAFLREMPDGRIPNLAFRNRGDLTFESVGEAAGLDWVGASHGAAYGDLDRDGDLDLVVNNVDDPALIFENQTEGVGNALRITFRGPDANPQGIGARVTLRQGGDAQVAEHYLARGYESSVEPGLHFGVGTASRIENLEVRWPGGRTQILADVPVDPPLVLDYAQAQDAPPRKDAALPPLLTEMTDALTFLHRENPFDDLARETLLPYETSKLGPALAVGDVQGDGLDDLYIGGAMGQSGVLFVQGANGEFEETPGPWSVHAGREDTAATFFDADGDGDMDLYVASGGNEPAPDSPSLQDRLYLNSDGTFADATDQLPEVRTSGGVVVAGDVDGDGDDDLFVGGRLLPGRYPLTPKSVLLRNDGGRFDDATATLAPGLQEAGMVTAARFADIDGDADLDLIVAGEWMPIVVATNEGGTLTSSPLPNSEGWWRSLAFLEGPEGPRIVAGNVGRSIKFRASLDAPFRVFAKDFDESGSLDIVLSMQNDGELYPVRGRECSSQQMPFIAEKFATYDAYGKATLRDVYGEDLDTALALRAHTFDSAVWTAKDGVWNSQSLPLLAQIGTVHGTVVHDVDQDGHLDLIVAGNLEKTEVETPRIDGGTGWVLKGSASGVYTPISSVESGFTARGDVKGLAKLRLSNGTGVVVVRNHGPATLFRIAEPGAG
ncbi:MAG: VCBS repeat-containing protein [Myxococcota bacterium]